MQWRAKFNPKPHNLGFLHLYEWRKDANVAFLRALLNEQVKGVIVGRAAVGVAGGVLFDRSYQDGGGADDLCPTDGGREEVGVTEGNVGDRDLIADMSVVCRCVRNGDIFVGKGRSADLTKEVHLQWEQLLKAED